MFPRSALPIHMFRHFCFRMYHLVIMDSVTDRQTDSIMMPIDRLKTSFAIHHFDAVQWATGRAFGLEKCLLQPPNVLNNSGPDLNWSISNTSVGRLCNCPILSPDRISEYRTFLEWCIHRTFLEWCINFFTNQISLYP